MTAIGFEYEAGESWCPICEEWGHIAMDCPELPDNDVEPEDP